MKNEKKKKKKKKRRSRKKRKKQEGEKMVEIKKVVKKWEIWDKKEEVAKSKEEAKKLVSQRFHKYIHIFGKKVSKRMLMKKLWEYTIEVKKGFVLRKRKVYLLLREERGEI